MKEKTKKISNNQKSLVQKKFEYFRDCTVLFQKMFGLFDVDIRINLSKLPNMFCCNVYLDRPAGNAKIDVNILWLLDDRTNSDKEIKRVALHEIIEIFFFDIRDALENSKNNEDKIDELVHSVVNRIVNVIEPN